MIESPEQQPPLKDANAKDAANAMLRESEENYRGLFENAVTGIFQTTPQGRFLRVNPALASMFGYVSPQEMIQSITDISTQLYPDPAERKKILDLLNQQENPVPVEIEFLHRDGHHFFASVIVRLIRDAAGAVVCYEGTVVDSTARRLAEDKLRESEDRFRKIFSNSPLGMALVTPDFRFYSVNPAWVSMTGYSEAELLSMSFKDITHPDYLAGDVEHIRELALGTIPVYSTEKKYIRKDQSILCGFIRVVAIRDQQEAFKYFAAQIEDITGHKRAEAQREQLIKELAVKNAELDRFTYTVSHDLKSPLLGIRAYLSLMETALDAGKIDQVREFIPKISTAAISLENLINTLLTLSRSGRVVEKPARIPFTDLAREAAGMLEVTMKERGVTLVIPDSLPAISGDRQRLLQVMTNLLDNAVKFMGDQKEPSIVVGVCDDKQTPVFFVKDNGMGIRQEDQSKVFGLFERLNAEIPGTGIGLATVKRIIEAHGGTIRMESDGPGKGTTFRFTLPVGKNSPDKTD